MGICQTRSSHLGRRNEEAHTSNWIRGQILRCSRKARFLSQFSESEGDRFEVPAVSFVPPHWDTLVSVSVSVPVTRLCIGVSWATQSKKKTKKYGDRTSPGCREGKRRNVSLPLRDAAHRPNARKCASASAASTNSPSWVLQRAAAHKLHCPFASPVTTKIFDESGVSTCPRAQTSRTPLNSPLVRIVQALS